MPSAFRRLQVDNQLDLGRLLHRQVGRLFAFSRCGPCRRRQGVRFGKVAVAANGRSAQREASRAQRLKSIFKLFELGDVLIDALFPFLAQRFPDLRWYRMDTRQNGQLLGDFLEAEARALRQRDVDDR